MDMEHDHPLQSRHLDLDDLAPRRRSTAGYASYMAKSIERFQTAGRELGVPFPEVITPATVLDWADALERKNGTESTP
jgi:hypothetical protein